MARRCRIDESAMQSGSVPPCIKCRSNDAGQYTTFIIEWHDEEKPPKPNIKFWFCQICGAKWPKGGMVWKRPARTEA